MKEKKKIIVLLGPPGAGKGTIAQCLNNKHANIKHISLGSICRELALEDSVLGKLIKETIDAGNLIDIKLVSEIINNIFTDFLNEKNLLFDILILDGFPRTFEQAFLFFELFKKYSVESDFYIILIKLNEFILHNRLINRYICSNINCDQIYSIKSYQHNILCLKCNSNLFQRKDDDKSIIAARIDKHYKHENQIIKYFIENKILYYEINGDDKMESIISNIYNILNNNNFINS